ncbi:hypothetical protein ACFE04_004793 [Oxalis oulophora]
MPSTKTQTLATLLLAIICSSTVIQAREQFWALPPEVDEAVPPIDGDDLGPVDGSLFFGFSKFRCFGVILRLGHCIGDIIKGLSHHALKGVGPKCCSAVINPKTGQCLAQMSIFAFLKIPDHSKALADFCGAPQATTQYMFN